MSCENCQLEGEYQANVVRNQLARAFKTLRSDLNAFNNVDIHEGARPEQLLAILNNVVQTLNHFNVKV